MTFLPDSHRNSKACPGERRYPSGAASWRFTIYMVRGWKGESQWKVGRGRGGFDQVLWFAVSTRCNHATQMTPQASCLQMAKKPRNFCSFDREIPSSQIFWRLEKATVLKATRRLSCSFLWIPENFLWTKWKMQLLNSPSLICYALQWASGSVSFIAANKWDAWTWWTSDSLYTVGLEVNYENRMNKLFHEDL